MWQSFYHQGPRINTKPCGKYPPPQGFVSLRASSWSTLNRKASCPFVSLRGQPSSARLRVPSCLFVVNTQPQGFVSLRGPSWLTPTAARPSRPLASLRGQNLNRKASCHFVALGGKKTPPQAQESLSGKKTPPQGKNPLSGKSPGKHVLQHVSQIFSRNPLATPQKAPIFANRAAASGPTFGGKETTFPLPATEKRQKGRK